MSWGILIPSPESHISFILTRLCSWSSYLQSLGFFVVSLFPHLHPCSFLSILVSSSLHCLGYFVVFLFPCLYPCTHSLGYSPDLLSCILISSPVLNLLYPYSLLFFFTLFSVSSSLCGLGLFVVPLFPHLYPFFLASQMCLLSSLCCVLVP